MEKGSPRRGAARARQRYWMPQKSSPGPGSSRFPGKPPLEPTHRGRELRAWRANGDCGFPEVPAWGRQESSGDLGRGSQSSTAGCPSFLQPHQQSFPHEPLPRALLSPAVLSVTKWKEKTPSPAVCDPGCSTREPHRNHPEGPWEPSFWTPRPEILARQARGGAQGSARWAGPGECTLRAPLRAPRHASSCLCRPLQLPGRKVSGCSQLSGARSTQTSN